MVNAPTDSHADWAWPALIQSLQRDIAHLREMMDEARKENAAVREAHREQLDELIEELREVRSHLEPIISEREATQKARREVLWGWAGKGGWLILLGILMTAWHYISKHFKFEVIS